MVSGPVWQLRGKTLRGGLWDLDFKATAQEATTGLQVVVRVNDRIHGTFHTACTPGLRCMLSSEDTLDTDTLPRGRLRIRVIAADDRLTREVDLTVRSTPLAPRCPARRYRVFFLGRRFLRLAFTHAQQLCEPTLRQLGGVHDVSYIYGNCDASSGSCVAPLELTSGPLCESNPRSVAYKGRSMRLLHVPALLYDQGGGWALDIFTGHTTISIGAADDTSKSRRVVLAAARQLHYAPRADIPDGSRDLVRLPLDAHGPPVRRLPAPDHRELTSPKPC